MTAHIPRIIGSNRRFFSPAADRIAAGEESARPTPQPNQSHRRPRTPIATGSTPPNPKRAIVRAGISPIRQQGRLSLGAPQPRAKSNASAARGRPGVSRRAGGGRGASTQESGSNAATFSARACAANAKPITRPRARVPRRSHKAKGKKYRRRAQLAAGRELEQMPRARTCRFRRGRGPPGAPDAALGHRAQPRPRAA